MTKLAQRARRSSAILRLSAWLVIGCGQTAGSPAAGHGSGAAATDAGAVDASDTGAIASSPDAGSVSISGLSCALEPTQLEVPIDERGERTWDALQTGDTIHLAYEVSTCEDLPTAQARAIRYLAFESSGELGEATPVADAGDEVCSVSRSPCLVPDPGHPPLLFYASNRLGVDELFQSQIGRETKDVRLTSESEADSDSEQHTVCAPYGASPLLGYVNAATGTQRAPVGQIVTRRVGFPEQEILPSGRGMHIAELALGVFADQSKVGGVLAWIADTGESRAIMAQRLDAAGKASGDPVLLSERAGPLSNVSLALLPTGSDRELAGAIAYGISLDGEHTQLRFRTIGLDGSFGPELALTNGAIDAHGIAIARFAAGYVLVYRVVAAGAETAMHARVVSLRGNAGAHAERIVVRAEPRGSAPKVFVTSDGRITVVFSDTTRDGSTLRAVRAICDP